MGKKVVVVAAINGGMQQDREGARIPCTPAEIADEAYRCYKAGAAVVHVHARDENRRNSGDPKLYAEIVQRIRDKCEILIQTTNGIGIRRDTKTGELVWPTDEERLQLLKIHPRQDLFGIASGPWTSSILKADTAKKRPTSTQSIWCDRPSARYMAWAQRSSTKSQSALHRLMRLANEGVFDKDASHIWLLHGGGFGATPPLARNVIFSIDEGQRLFPNAKWGVVGTGRVLIPHRHAGTLDGL